MKAAAGRSGRARAEDVPVESVTFAAQTLQRRGLIQYTRGRITLVDRDGLEKASCECYEETKSVFSHPSAHHGHGH